MQPPPYKIKVVEPIRLVDAARRRDALAAAGCNTFLLQSSDVFIDLLTDSGTGAMSQEQRAAMELGDEAYAGSRSFERLERAMHDVYGWQHLIPTHQGRGAEHLLSRVLVEPGQLVLSNLYFTTSREHAELAGARWVDVSVPEAADPESRYPFKGDIDVAKLRELIVREGRERIAFVRQEACLNMAGGQPFSLANLRAVRADACVNTACGQPFSLANLRAVRAVTRELDVPFFLDGTRASENALFVKEREHEQELRTVPALLREFASLSDGAVFSSKKDHFVPIGGFVAVDDDELAQRLRELVVVYEGFPHYGGMAGHDMEALAQGIREAADEDVVRAYVDQARYLGAQLEERGVPIVVPVGAHAVFLDAKRFLPHVEQTDFPAQALAAALYLAGGIRSMERGIVSGQHGAEPYDGLELVRLTIPRRVYTREHLDYVADVVADVYDRRDEVPGLAMTYEPAHLRFFQARFEPLAPFPSFAAVEEDVPAAV